MGRLYGQICLRQSFEVVVATAAVAAAGVVVMMVVYILCLSSVGTSLATLLTCSQMISGAIVQVAVSPLIKRHHCLLRASLLCELCGLIGAR